MVFSALQLSQYGGPQVKDYARADDNKVSWGTDYSNLNSDTENKFLYKKIANNRFFLALPIEIQSIITETAGLATQIKAVYQNNIRWEWHYLNSIETNDLAFIPTYFEVGGSGVDYESEAYRAMPWYQGNSYVYAYGTNSFSTTPTSQASFMNLRFFNIPININENRIYYNYTGTVPVYDKINTNNNEIRCGDIFIHNTGTTEAPTYTAYIYADEAAKAAGAQVISAVPNDVLYCSVGGWIKSGPWWLRTAATMTEQSATTQPFFYIQDNTGEPVKRTTPVNGAWFVYSFGI